MGDEGDLLGLHGLFDLGLEFIDDIRDAARFVSEIVGHDVDESTEAIISALDDFLAEHEEDDDTWYSFHEFIEDAGLY